MTIEEKIKGNAGNIVKLYKEGVFWVAYEESAYRLSQVKSLKASKKHIKSINRDVVSVGFPDSALKSVVPFFQVKEESDRLVILESETPLDPAVFESWKAKINYQLSVNSKQLSVNSEQLPVNSEQLSVNSDQLSMIIKQLSMISKQLSMLSDQISIHYCH
jgi:hypothetical protein